MRAIQHDGLKLMVQSFNSLQHPTLTRPVCLRCGILVLSGTIRSSAKPLGILKTIQTMGQNENQSLCKLRDSGSKSKLPLQRSMPRIRDAVQQYVGADLAACHGPCTLTRTPFWSEDLTSNGNPGDIGGKQGPRQTGALI